MESLPYECRKMTTDDIERILALERICFSLPWTRGAFEDDLANELAEYYVLVDNNEIIGYCGMWIVIDEAHITNVCIAPEYRRRQLAKNLMKYMMGKALLRGAEMMTLEVRVGNTAAKQLYESLGFREYGIRKGYYSDNNEDALILWNRDIEGVVSQ